METHIIYFDGVCNLCNWAVRFLIRNDQKKIFSFASLQSDFARKIFKHPNSQDIKYNSVIYQEGNRFYYRSEAALNILKSLGGIWRWMVIFKVIPKPWRDRLYDFIANQRYKWFGKRDQCMVPSAEHARRFLE